jgi:hypothetical protein
MPGTTVAFNKISSFLQPDIEAAVRFVLDGAEPAWSVSVLNDEASGDWNIGAQPGDGEPFHGVLKESEHSTQAIQQLLSGWYEQFEEWKADMGE